MNGRLGALARGDRRLRFAGVIAYAAAMGWFEAVVVVYIRAILGIARTETIPPAGEVMARIQSVPWLLRTEQSREAATMVMLLAVGFLASRSWRAKFAAYLVSFGAWDLVYYLALWVMLRWPRGFGTMDLLFLIPPHPLWYQPVWLPMSIATLMVVAGGGWFFREDARFEAARPRDLT